MHVFYDCPSFNESVKGDKLHYRIYVLKKQDFLYLLETAPVPEFPTVPPDAAAPTVSEQAIVNSTPAEADAASEVEVIAFSAEVPALEVAADTEADSAVAAAEEEEETQLLADSAEEQMWACEVCTLLNAPHLTECSVCVTPRPAPAARAAGHPATASSRRAAPSSAPAGGPVAVGWWCSACTFINPISLSA